MLSLWERLYSMGNIKYEIVTNLYKLEECELQELDKLSDDELVGVLPYFQNNKMEVDYNIRFMRLAREYSTWSKDPKKKIGCVAVKDKQVLSQGYNGFPRNIKDDWRLYVKSKKLPMVVHAEMNMLLNALNNSINIKESIVYIYGLPSCSDCVKSLIQAGVSKIYMCDETNGKSQSWSFDSDTFSVARSMLEEANIQYFFIDVNELSSFDNE